MPVLTPTDLADRLKISRSKARALAAPGGPIPCTRIGRLIRFDEADIMEYEQQCRSITIKCAVDIALSSTKLSTETGSELQSYFRKLGIKPKQRSSTEKKAAVSTR
ncbi:helix-turn-helix domain-containing protein [Bordetella petrii]|uniref:helix-turn-helix domain-containing protein n=1 Tax=Bordetella petrii TaxID=94624 RepID=UPI0009DB39AE